MTALAEVVVWVLFAIVVISARWGTLPKTRGSSVNRLAHITGSEAFFEPPI